MAEITSGIRMTADARGVVSASEQAATAQAGYRESLQKTAASSKEAAAESAKFVQRLKEEADTLGMSRSMLLAYQGDQLKLAGAQKEAALASLQQIQAHENATAAASNSKVAIGALTAVVAAFAAAQILAVKGVVDEAAAFNNLSQSYGISTQGLSAYKYQMSLAGGTQSEFEASMRALSQRMQEAQLGVGRGAQIFGVLGLSATDAAGRTKSLEQIFPEFADKIAVFRDGANKTALVTDTLGRSGERLVPMLNQGSEGFRAAATEADQFKRIIGPEMAKQADDFNSNLTKMNALLKGQAYTIANEALPSLNSYLNKLIEASKFEGGNLFKGLFTANLGGGDAAQLEKARAQMLALPPEERNPRDLAAIDRSLAFLRTQTDSDWQRRFDAQNARVRAMFGLDAPVIGRGGGGAGAAGGDGEGMLISLRNQLAEAQGQGSMFDRTMRALTEGTKQYSVETQAAALALAGEIDEQRKANVETEKARRAADEATKAYNTGVEAQFRSIATLEDHNTKLAEHNREIGQSKSQIDLLKAARAQEVLAIAQKNLALVQMHDATTEELAIAQARVKAAEDLVRLLNEGAVAEAAHEGAKHVAEEWKRTSDNIERSLTDALMRGFDKGKSFGQNLKDGLVNAFKTAILTPIIQPIVRPVAQALSSAVGGITSALFGGNAFAGGGGGGGGSALSVLSNASSIGNLFGGGGMAQTFADFGNFFGNIGMATEAGGTFGVMDAISGFAMSNPWTAAAAIAAPFLLDGLFGGGGGPKTGEILLQRQSEKNWMDNNADSTGRSFVVGSNNLPGGSESWNSQIWGLIPDLNNPAKYDQDMLAKYVGTTISGMDVPSMIQNLLNTIAPAAVAAQARSAGFQSQFAQQAQLVASLQQYSDSLDTSQYLAPMDRFAGARSQFDETLAAARGGDVSAAQALGGRASALLAAGRDVYASGPEFASLMKEVNRDFGEVLRTGQEKQHELLADLPLSIKQASQGQIDAIDKQTAALVAKFDELSKDVRRLASAVGG